MKRIFLSLVMLSAMNIARAQNNYALLIIDVQDFYFPGGRSELVEPARAAALAALAAAHTRSEGQPVIYIQHRSDAGMEINDLVRPSEGDVVFVKEEVNSFLGTPLKAHLDGLGTDTLVICGMQTQMCVEAAVRAAHDYGYHVIMLHDACASRDLRYGDILIPSAMVHASTLSTLRSYASVLSVSEWTGEGKKH